MCDLTYTWNLKTKQNKKNELTDTENRWVFARGGDAQWAKWMKWSRDPNFQLYKSILGCNEQHGDYRSQYCIAYLKVTKRVYKFPSQKKINYVW